MSDLPTREEWDGSLRPREWFDGKHSGALWDNAYDTLLAAYVDGTLQTRREFIDSLDVEAFASWVYTFTAPFGVVPWKRLPQQRREVFVTQIGAGMDAAYPKEE